MNNGLKQAFFLCVFEKTQGRKNSSLTKTQRIFGPKTQPSGGFWVIFFLKLKLFEQKTQRKLKFLLKSIVFDHKTQQKPIICGKNWQNSPKTQ